MGPNSPLRQDHTSQARPLEVRVLLSVAVVVALWATFIAVAASAASDDRVALFLLGGMPWIGVLLLLASLPRVSATCFLVAAAAVVRFGDVTGVALVTTAALGAVGVASFLLGLSHRGAR